jgi:hypothetical protein
MPDGEREQICFEPRAFKGSRFRCLLLTHQSHKGSGFPELACATVRYSRRNGQVHA